MFDANKIKKDFPILKRKINGKPLVYLDNAATSQKPQVVIDALLDYYSNHNANVHRGIHTLGDESTKLFHKARETVAHFFGARDTELIWTRNTTEAINLVAYAWARRHLQAGDIIITSELEHHSNLVTWQEVAKDTGAGLTFVEVTHSASSGQADGQIDLEHLSQLLEALKDQVKLIAFAHISNATGAVLDTTKLAELRKKHAPSAKILLDIAQSAPHMPLDFDSMDVEFMAFSGHKMYGPMGIGGLLVKQGLLETMEPFLVGGGMIREVHLESTQFGDLPDRFDAGTPNVAGAIGLAAAVEYLQKIGMEQVEKHGRELVEYALEKLAKVSGVTIVGPVPQRHSDTVSRLGSVAFTLEGAHAHDVAQILDSQGIAVRSGHHCTMPLHQKFNWVATTRASFGIYNTKTDIDALVKGLEQVKKVFKLNT